MKCFHCNGTGRKHLKSIDQGECEHCHGLGETRAFWNLKPLPMKPIVGSAAADPEAKFKKIPIIPIFAQSKGLATFEEWYRINSNALSMEVVLNPETKSWLQMAYEAGQDSVISTIIKE